MNIRDKYAARIDELIELAESIPKRTRKKWVAGNFVTGENRYKDETYLSLPEFIEWRTNCLTILDAVVPASSLHRKSVESFSVLKNTPASLDYGVAFLKSIRADMVDGFFDPLADRIDAELSADYLAQADQILSEGSGGSKSHVAAAVLAGATLEHGLRSICEALEPPEPTRKSNKPMSMGSLIEALKVREAFNELVAKQLRAWADIRNAAAHGRFDDFSKDQVRMMVDGVGSFLASHR